MKKAIIIFMTFVLCVVVMGCGADESEKVGLWDNAVHTEDTELGDGARTVFVRVKAEDKSVLFTLHTDAKTVGEALIENSLVSGDEGAYGIYIKEVNGIVADYDKDQTYWSFNKDGKPMPTGVDQAEFADGEQFELVYSK